MANVWKEAKFEKRMQRLNRISLYKLYPSESWAILSTLLVSKSVLDAGCGDGNKFPIINKLNSKIKFTGFDLNNNLIQTAKKKFNNKNSKFFTLDINANYNFIKNKKYDLVMAWAFFYSLKNYKELIVKLIKNNCKKYLIFDLRVSNIKNDIIDTNKSFTFYKDKKKRMIYVISSLSSFKKYLNKHLKGLITDCFITGYSFPPSKHVVLKGKIKPPFVASVILKKGITKNKINYDIKLPNI